MGGERAEGKGKQLFLWSIGGTTYVDTIESDRECLGKEGTQLRGPFQIGDAQKENRTGGKKKGASKRADLSTQTTSLFQDWSRRTVPVRETAVLKGSQGDPIQLREVSRKKGGSFKNGGKNKVKGGESSMTS